MATNRLENESSETTEPDAVTAEPLRQRAMSRKEYLDSLPTPSKAEIESIDNIQVRREGEIDAKYTPVVEHSAATTIQKAYRGHRERRQMQGLILEPSTRWSELIRELRFRAAVAQSHERGDSPLPRNVSNVAAKAHWDRITSVAEYASAGESRGVLFTDETSPSPAKHRRRSKKSDVDQSMLMDLRYFLEMVDEKHRYGANLQIYHEEWQRADTKQNFFQWLDQGDGRHINHPYCDRAKLEHERIRYLSKEERRDYLVTVDEQGLLRWEKNGELISTDATVFRDSMHGIVLKDSSEPSFDDASVKSNLSASRKLNRRLAAMRDSAIEKLAGMAPRRLLEGEPNRSWSSSDTSDSSDLDPDDAILHQGVTSDKTPRKRLHVSPATILNHLLRKTIRPGTWIYVADTVGRLYVGIKSSGAFQHASFLSGARICSAGSIVIENGQLIYLSPLSGHYRPTTRSFKNFVESLKTQKAGLSKLRVSWAYQILLGIEYYGAARHGMRRLTAGKEARPKSSKKHSSEAGNEHLDGAGVEHCGSCTVDNADMDPNSTLSATALVEEHWRLQHRHGLRELMNDLNIKRRSQEHDRISSQ